MQKIKDLSLKILNNPAYFWSLLIAIYVIARVATWFYPFDSDHWIFWYVGKNWFQGGSLYVTAWDHKPPLIFLFNGLMWRTMGGNIVLHRIFFTLLSIFDIFLFYKLLKLVLPKIMTKSTDIAVKVSLLVYVFWRNLSQFTSSANNTENFGLLFVLGMLISYVSFRDDKKWWKLLIAGSCFSVLFFLKGNFLLLGVPIGIIMIADYWKDLKKFFLYSFIFVLPLFLQTGAWLAYFWKLGTFNEFFIASFGFSSKYAKSAWAGDVSSNIILLLTLVVFLFPLLLLFYVSLRQSRKNLKNPTFWLIKMLVIAGLLLTLGVGSFYPYYFVISMPVFVIVMVYGLFNMQDMNKYFRYFVYLVFGASIVISLAISMKQLYNSFSGSVKEEAEEYAEIADYVKSNTNASDKVFDYDYGATFYRLSERDSGSRFVSASVLLLDYRGNYGFDLNKLFMQDMEKSQAKYVVVYADRNSLYYQNKPLVEYFDTHYHVEKVFEKFLVLKRN